MTSMIDIVSILTRNMPNSFFESFQIKELDSVYDIRIKTWVMDHFITKNMTSGWVTNPSVSKHCYIKVACIQDEKVFNSITKENYLDVLTKNNFQISTLKLKNLTPEQLLEENPEITTDTEKIYKFLYDSNFRLPISNFLGFITYCYYDSGEYAKEFSIKNINDKKYNSSFMLEKFELIKDGMINNLIIRPHTKQDNLWCSEYSSINNNYFYFVDDKKYPITKKTEEVRVVDLDSSKSLVKLEYQGAKKESEDVTYDNLSAISDVHHSVDEAGNLNIMFSFDSINYIFKNSSVFSSLGKDSFNDPTVRAWIKQLSVIKDIQVSRIDKNTKKEKLISNTTTNKDPVYLDNSVDSFSDIHFYKFTDTEYSYFNAGLFSYRVDISIDDGVLKYLQNLVRHSKEENELFKNYLNNSLNFANKVDKNDKHIYYNFNTDSFTDLYTVKQSYANSDWSKCFDCCNSYTLLYNIIEENKLETTSKELLNSLSPTNASLDVLQSFGNHFDSLLKKANLILDKKTNTDFRQSYILINSVKPSNGKCFYDYSADFSSYRELTSNNKQYFPFRQIDKIYRLTSFGLDTQSIVESANLKSEEDLDFKISDTTIQFLLQELKNNLTEEQVSYLYLYNILTDQIDNMMYLNKFKNSSSPGNAIEKILKTKNREQLISIYKNLTGSTSNFANSTIDDFITGTYSITKYVQSNINFYLTFLNNKLDDSFYKNYKKIILFILRYGKLTRVEYLSGYENSDKHNIKFLKKPIWTILDINDSKVKNIMSSGQSLLIRFMQVNTDEIGFFDDSRLNLEILNRYFILSN